MFTKTFAVAALAGVAAAAPAGVTAKISPSGETAPSGCSANYPGKFVIAPQNVTSNSKRDVTLVSTLVDGVLTDSEGRTGYIAANNQYQYDAPPQAGALYTAGFSICQNGSLALGNSAIFYACLSGTFYNLYDENEGAQCHQVYIQVSPYTESSTTAVASQIADGQVTASPVSSVSQISDGQIQAPTNGAVTQIHDGQIQAATSTAAPVTQISDGQIQAPTKAAVVTQISDGQIQAPTNGTTVSTSKPIPFTGAASSVSVGLFSIVAGLVAIMAL